MTRVIRLAAIRMLKNRQHDTRCTITYRSPIPSRQGFTIVQNLTDRRIITRLSFNAIASFAVSGLVLGAVGVGATVYFGSPDSRRQIMEVSEAFERAHELGMFTILWCYLRNNEFKREDQDNHNATDLAGQAHH